MSVFQSICKHLLPASAKRTFGPTRDKSLSNASPHPLARVEHITPDAEWYRTKMDELKRIASGIPSMGGSEIGPQLRKAAREAPANTSIVEVGSWLGAGTAQLALGVRERGSAGSIAIHCYDRWEANEPEVAKAVRFKNVKFEIGDDTLPWVMSTLRPFAVPISFVKADLRDATWGGGPISVYVDDAAKTPTKFYHVLKTFGPHWIPDVTVVVLMDFHFWEKTGSDKHKCQKRFIDSHKSNFKLIEGFRTDSSDAFMYKSLIDFDKLKYQALV